MSAAMGALQRDEVIRVPLRIGDLSPLGFSHQTGVLKHIGEVLRD